MWVHVVPPPPLSHTWLLLVHAAVAACLDMRCVGDETHAGRHICTVLCCISAACRYVRTLPWYTNGGPDVFYEAACVYNMQNRVRMTQVWVIWDMFNDSLGVSAKSKWFEWLPFDALGNLHASRGIWISFCLSSDVNFWDHMQHRVQIIAPLFCV